tara:strand:- start:20 stop:217 length:198 start_codon:yes stop_codon:yes gene_type:complete
MKEVKKLLIKKYENEIAFIKLEMEPFLTNPVGVADHGCFVETIEEKISRIADLLGKIEALKMVLK